MRRLSEVEETALQTVKAHGGALLVYHVPETNCRDEFGNIEPGMTVYRRLEKLGLVVICEPIVEADGFEWTPAIELKDATDPA